MSRGHIHLALSVIVAVPMLIAEMVLTLIGQQVFAILLSMLLIGFVGGRALWAVTEVVLTRRQRHDDALARESAFALARLWQRRNSHLN